MFLMSRIRQILSFANNFVLKIVLRLYFLGRSLSTMINFAVYCQVIFREIRSKKTRFVRKIESFRIPVAILRLKSFKYWIIIGKNYYPMRFPNFFITAHAFHVLENTIEKKNRKLKNGKIPATLLQDLVRKLTDFFLQCETLTRRNAIHRLQIYR